MREAWFRLEGKVALVTGAATGIGAGTAIALARNGADVAISDKPGKDITDVAEQVASFGVRVITLAVDVREPDQRRLGVERVRDELGGVDILVNNAGINRPNAGLTVDEENWDDHFSTNIKGGFFLAQLVAPMMMEKKWGRIIWISSQSGLIGIPGQPVYCSTKGAVIQAVRTLGVEWARHGITVNSVAPTFVETNLTRKRLQEERFRSFVLGKIPAGRLAEVDEIAAAVVFLASPQASMVNAHTLAVDGGWTAW